MLRLGTLEFLLPQAGEGAGDRRRCGFARPVIILASLLASFTSARADAVEDFYKNRVVTLVIGSAEGGSYDMTGRLMARTLGKYLPGNPTIIAQNMPGASSVRAYQWLYNVAPKDGSTLVYVQPTVVLNKLTDAAANYEPQKFTVIGRFDSFPTFGTVWHTSGITSVEDAKQRDVFIGASSAVGAAAFVPWALNRLVGTRFRVVRGYENETATTLAMERGETQGVGSSSLEYLQTKADWFSQGKARIIYTIALQRHRGALDAPTILELARNDADRKIFELMASASTIGRVVYAPPGTPSDRAAALRKAFELMSADPVFIAEATKLLSTPDPLAVSEIEAIIQSNMSAPKSVVERLQQVMQPMD